MSQEIALTPKALFGQDNVKKRFEELLGSRAQGFVTSVLQIVSTEKSFDKVDAYSVYNAAAIAATLDLPINKNLGFAWIIAYGDKAQFQMGYRGYVQLAMRTGQYSKMNVVEVYESQFTSWNPLTEDLQADFTIEPTGNIVGYCAYFRMLNGFEKIVYWPSAKVTAHAVRYSKSYKSGPWQTDPNEMGKKTVLKMMLNKWGYLSIDMQRAMKIDQAVIKDENAEEVEFIDHQLISSEAGKSKEESEFDRAVTAIEKATTVKKVDEIVGKCSDELKERLKEIQENKVQKILDSEMNPNK